MPYKVTVNGETQDVGGCEEMWQLYQNTDFPTPDEPMVVELRRYREDDWGREEVEERKHFFPDDNDTA